MPSPFLSQCFQWANFIGLYRQRFQVRHRHVPVGYQPVIESCFGRSKPDNRMETRDICSDPLNALHMLIQFVLRLPSKAAADFGDFGNSPGKL